MATQIQVRRDTAANWTSADPTLATGEIGFETDQNKFKIGDGSTAYTSLAYAGGSEIGNTLANLNTITSETGQNISITADGGTMTLGVDNATHSTLNKDGSIKQIVTDQFKGRHQPTYYSASLGSGNVQVDYDNGEHQYLTLTGGDPLITDIINTANTNQGRLVVIQPSGTDCLIQVGGNIATPGGTQISLGGGNNAYDQYFAFDYAVQNDTVIITNSSGTLKAPNA